MRILSASIFSKSFGGKIKRVQTDVNKKTTFAKKLKSIGKVNFSSSNKFFGKVLISQNSD